MIFAQAPQASESVALKHGDCSNYEGKTPRPDGPQGIDQIDQVSGADRNAEWSPSEHRLQIICSQHNDHEAVRAFR
jgi:hypothetical protein